MDYISDNLRNRVFARDGQCCQYCGRTEGPFEIDHVYPKGKGGETTLNNLVVSCYWCNRKKHTNIGMWPKTSLEKERAKHITIYYLTTYTFISTLTWEFPGNNPTIEAIIRIVWLVCTICSFALIYNKVRHEL